MYKIVRVISITLMLVVLLGACNMPADSNGESGPSNVEITFIAQTIEAELTQEAILNPPTIPVFPTSTRALPTSTLAIFTSTRPVATRTPTCDLGRFIKDITIPDGTEFEPDETFTKTWQLKNIGTCTWNGYTLVFDSGESMGGPASTSIGTVSPNQEVNLSVDLKAPSSDGSYRGYWRIKNNSGVLIPVSGGYQSKSFFVDIKVKTTTPVTTTLTLNATGGTEGGTVYEPAASKSVDNTKILAGDTVSNHLGRGYMSFDISSISGKTVSEATLDLSSCTQENDPFGSLSNITLGEVQYALPLDQSDYTVSGSGIDTLTSMPGSDIDVTSYVQTRVTEGKSRFQIRFHPNGPSDVDGQADHIECGASSPKLTITYQP